MKILHTSDWHLGKSLHDFSLLDDQSHFITWLLELLTQQPVDAILITGDVYDRPVPSGAAVQLYDYFLSKAVGELGIPVFAIAGNHDSASRLQFGSSLYQKSGYYVAGNITPAPATVLLKDTLGDVHITLLPYLHVAEVRAMFPDEPVRTFDDAYRVLLSHYRHHLDFSQRNLMLAHGFFSNLDNAAQEEPMLTSDSEIGIGGMDIVDVACFQDFDYVALGHLHAPQRCGGNARYSGSPLKYSLSEERQNKSVTFVELSKKGNLSTSTLPVPPLRDVRTVQGAMEELLEPSFHHNKQFGDYVFADVLGPECAYPMQKLRTLFPWLLGLRFVEQARQADMPMPEIKAAAQVSRLSSEELFCRFFRHCKGYDIPPEQLAVVRSVLQDMREGEEL